MKALKVLIADDSPTIRRFIRRIMEISHPGCAISEAGNGWEALTQLERDPADLIFLDLIMPEMQGEEFLARTMDNLHARRTGVIVLSSANTADLRHKLHNEELVRFAKKPVVMDELISTVDSLLIRCGFPASLQADPAA